MKSRKGFNSPTADESPRISQQLWGLKRCLAPDTSAVVQASGPKPPNYSDSRGNSDYIAVNKEEREHFPWVMEQAGEAVCLSSGPQLWQRESER